MHNGEIWCRMSDLSAQKSTFIIMTSQPKRSKSEHITMRAVNHRHRIYDIASNTPNVEVSMVYAIPHRISLNIINLCVANKNKLICDSFFFFASVPVATHQPANWIAMYTCNVHGTWLRVDMFYCWLRQIFIGSACKCNEWWTIRNSLATHGEQSQYKWYISISWWHPRDTATNMEHNWRLNWTVRWECSISLVYNTYWAALLVVWLRKIRYNCPIYCSTAENIDRRISSSSSTFQFRFSLSLPFKWRPLNVNVRYYDNEVWNATRTKMIKLNMVSAMK